MEGFFQSVYKIVEKIPAGSVATYGQIAMMLGRPRGGTDGGVGHGQCSPGAEAALSSGG